MLGIDGDDNRSDLLQETGVLLENNQIVAIRRFTPIIRAFENTPLEEAFTTAIPHAAVFRRAAAVPRGLQEMRLRDRRPLSALVRNFVAENAETMGADESAILLNLADDLIARNVNPERVEARIREFAAVTQAVGRALYINVPRSLVSLRGNLIFGEVSFYGPSPDWPLSADRLRPILEEILRRLKQMAVGRVNLVSTGGMIQLHGNRLTSITCAQSILEQIFAALEAGGGNVKNIPEAMTVSENTFTAPHNILVAVHTDMNHNMLSSFSPSFLAACFAESGIYVGNRAPGRGGRIVTSQIFEARAEAANLGVQID